MASSIIREADTSRSGSSKPPPVPVSALSIARRRLRNYRTGIVSDRNRPEVGIHQLQPLLEEFFDSPSLNIFLSQHFKELYSEFLTGDGVDLATHTHQVSNKLEQHGLIASNRLRDALVEARPHHEAKISAVFGPRKKDLSPPSTSQTPRSILVLTGEVPETNSASLVSMFAESIRSVAEKRRGGIKVVLLELCDLRDNPGRIDFSTAVGAALDERRLTTKYGGDITLAWAPSQERARPRTEEEAIQRYNGAKDVWQSLSERPSAGVLSVGGQSWHRELLHGWNRTVRRAPIRRPWLGLEVAGGVSADFFRRIRGSLYGPTGTAVSASLLDVLRHERPTTRIVAEAIEAILSLERWPVEVPEKEDLEDLVLDLDEADKRRERAKDQLLPALQSAVDRRIRRGRQYNSTLRVFARAGILVLSAVFITLFAVNRFLDWSQTQQLLTDLHVHTKVSSERLSESLADVGRTAIDLGRSVSTTLTAPISEDEVSKVQVQFFNKGTRRRGKEPFLAPDFRDAKLARELKTFWYIYAIQEASLDYPAIFLPGTDRWVDYPPKAKDQVVRLLSFFPEMRSLRSRVKPLTEMDLSTQGRAIRDVDVLIQRTLIKSGRPIVWMYLTLDNTGLTFQIPGNGDFSEQYMPKERPWYRQTLSAFQKARASGSSVGDLVEWVGPYKDAQIPAIKVVSVTCPVVYRGDFKGVVALDLARGDLERFLDEVVDAKDLDVAVLIDSQTRKVLAGSFGYQRIAPNLTRVGGTRDDPQFSIAIASGAFEDEQGQRWIGSEEPLRKRVAGPGWALITQRRVGGTPGWYLNHRRASERSGEAE